jgi:hypothetical protein
MHRFWQIVLIATFIPLCWLLMQAVHELGHATIGWATGGTVVKVVLYPTTISHTEILGGRHRAMTVWAGPITGVALPLALLLLFKAARWKWFYLAQFFAGFCLIANGVYLGIGSFPGDGDAGDLIRIGCPRWPLWLFGLLTVPLGLYLWNGLGPHFGRGTANGKVDQGAAIGSAVMLAVVVTMEMALSSPQ